MISPATPTPAMPSAPSAPSGNTSRLSRRCEPCSSSAANPSASQNSTPAQAHWTGSGKQEGSVRFPSSKLTCAGANAQNRSSAAFFAQTFVDRGNRLVFRGEILSWLIGSNSPVARITSSTCFFSPLNTRVMPASFRRSTR